MDIRHKNHTNRVQTAQKVRFLPIPTIHAHPVEADAVDTSMFYHIMCLFGLLLVNNKLFRDASISTSIRIIYPDLRKIKTGVDQCNVATTG